MTICINKRRSSLYNYLNLNTLLKYTGSLIYLSDCTGICQVNKREENMICNINTIFTKVNSFTTRRKEKKCNYYYHYIRLNSKFCFITGFSVTKWFKNELLVGAEIKVYVVIRDLKNNAKLFIKEEQ